MTEDQAEKTADVLIAAAVVGGAIFVLANPLLRRMAWQIARTAIAAGGPALVAEARRAWAQSAAAARPGRPGL